MTSLHENGNSAQNLEAIHIFATPSQEGAFYWQDHQAFCDFGTFAMGVKGSFTLQRLSACEKRTAQHLPPRSHYCK